MLNGSKLPLSYGWTHLLLVPSQPSHQASNRCWGDGSVSRVLVPQKSQACLLYSRHWGHRQADLWKALSFQPNQPMSSKSNQKPVFKSKVESNCGRQPVFTSALCAHSYTLELTRARTFKHKSNQKRNSFKSPANSLSNSLDYFPSLLSGSLCFPVLSLCFSGLPVIHSVSTRKTTAK